MGTSDIMLTPEQIYLRLRQRAEQLAQVPVAAHNGDTVEVVVFQLAEETYMLETCHVSEVVPLRQLTAIPCTPDYILGVINLRGRMVSVLDLRRFFELPLRGLSDLNRVVVIARPSMEFGLLTDHVLGTRTVSREQIRKIPANLSGIRSDYLAGITAQHWALLDAGRLLSDTRLVVNETV